eukprot:TRINITY_DN1495_c0_g1_i4.p1 TRINITY_DN1495_c0_g1~~TRINITY_DN1495_c0_g1_i4.p1  ORF type:complete len:376 (+),score=59.42 TRINITY_DN1495_c0_g1_i4:164-1291(+)
MTNTKRQQTTKRCYKCGEPGHLIRNCVAGKMEKTSPTGAGLKRVESGSTSQLDRSSSWASVDSIAYDNVTVSEVSSPSPSPATTDEKGFFIPTSGLVINNRYQVHSRIGKGTFAIVVSAHDLVTKTMVAIKLIRATKEALSDAEDELGIMLDINSNSRYFSHPLGLSLLLDTFFFECHKCFVFPLCGGSLFAELQAVNFKGIPARDVMLATYSTLWALRNLHSMGIIHCDIKPENILWTSSRSALHTTVVDFGCSYRDVDHKPSLIQTLYYRAPEVILRKKWSFATDIFSLGCVMYEMLTGSPLFKIEDEKSHIPKILEALDESSGNSIGSKLSYLNLPKEAINLIKAMLCVSPSERISAEQALHHPVFALYADK